MCSQPLTLNFFGSQQWVPGSMWLYISPGQGPQDGAHAPGKAIKFPPPDSASAGQPTLQIPILFADPLCESLLTLRPTLREGMHPMFSIFAARVSTPNRLTQLCPTPTLSSRHIAIILCLSVYSNYLPVIREYWLVQYRRRTSLSSLVKDKFLQK